MISLAPWQKIQAYLDLFGARHYEFCAALDNVKSAMDGEPRQFPSEPRGYVHPPV